MLCSASIYHSRRGAREAPRPPQERPKRLQEAPKSAPRGSKRPSRDPKSRSRGLYNSKDALLRCPATECKAGMPKNGGRAAVSPQRGRQSAARNGVEGIAACQTCKCQGPNHNCRSLICLTYGQFLVVLVSIGLSKSKLRREVGKIQI